MQTLAAFLALNGILVVFLSSAAGIPLYLNLVRGEDPHDWHLLHAGGTARGILLIALGGTINITGLQDSLTTLSAGLVVVFVWASTIAMVLRGITGETGFGLAGKPANRIGFILYVVGVLSLFPGLILLAWGFAKSL